MMNNYKVFIPTMGLKKHGFKRIGNQMVFDSGERTVSSLPIYLLILAQSSDTVISFSEVFVNLGSIAPKDKLIKFGLHPNGQLKLQPPSHNFNHLTSTDQDQIEEIIKRLQRNLKQWFTGGVEADSIVDEMAFSAT